jgi:hypothetical protein
METNIIEEHAAYCRCSEHVSELRGDRSHMWSGPERQARPKLIASQHRQHQHHRTAHPTYPRQASVQPTTPIASRVINSQRIHHQNITPRPTRRSTTLHHGLPLHNPQYIRRPLPRTRVLPPRPSPPCTILTTLSVYSAHEHSTAFTSTPLPTDITLELLLSIFALSSGIVLSAQALRPIEAAKWAGQLARDGQRSEGTYTREGEAVISEGDPYAFLGLDGGFGDKGARGEGRRGFWDAKGKRREYEEWVRSGGK